MHQTTAHILILALLLPASLAFSKTPTLSSLGERAMQHTAKILDFGPRPSGSKALDGVKDYVENHLKKSGFQLKRQSFEPTTPFGKRSMSNLIAEYTGKKSRILILACHLDSKEIPGIVFVGANDAASACALMLAMVPHLLSQQREKTLWLVFFDGEEAFGEWSAENSLYGSKELAKSIELSGLKNRIDAFVLLDMIGDKDLSVAQERRAHPKLVKKVTSIAKQKGFSKYFFQYRATIEDDHLPFHRLGIPTIDLIDFQYGRPQGRGAGSFFHTAADTIDKLSRKSLQIVGEVTLELLNHLDRHSL